MSKKMQEIFTPLREAFDSSPMDASTFLQIVASFISNDRPVVAHAMAGHMSEILQESEFSKEPTNWSRAVGETYWRTFFDLEQAERYGTHELLQQGEESMIQFRDILLSDVQAMVAQLASGSFHAESTTVQ